MRELTDSERFLFKSLVSALALAMFALTIVACTGTRTAYRSADTLEEAAYVVTEHYYAMLVEANRLADSGAPQAWIDRAAAREQQITPKILELRSQAAAYETLRSAENEAELASALSEAVVLVSEFIDLVKEGR